jgi:RNA polymerase sigma-70 factor (ECF subfamily)
MGMEQAKEITLVQRLVRMDEKAWETFCREFSAALLTFVRLRFGCGRELAEEIVQMSFVRCVKSIRSFDPARGRLFAWLKAVAKNEAHTLLPEFQTRPRGPSVGAPFSDVAREIMGKLDDASLPEEMLARQETQLLVQEAMMELPSRHREALVLKYVENRRVSEIAERLGHSEKAIESLLTRAREAFRTAFLRLLGTDETMESRHNP